MESLVGKKFEYKGVKIGHITVLTNPRQGKLLSIKGVVSTSKSCLVRCECGNKYELIFRNITTKYTGKCSLCGKVSGALSKKIRTKSLFEYWMSLWRPETHKPDTFKLPYFKGYVGDEYVAGFCYVSKGTYEYCSKVICIKLRGYLRYNKSRGNCERLGINYLGNKNKYIIVHRFAGKVPDGLQGDHINGITLDNRKHNIRMATEAENARNKKHTNNKYDLRGIGYIGEKKRPWKMQIIVDGKSYSKVFYNKEDAVEYRDCLSLHLHREFAYLNYKHKEDYYRSIMYDLLEDRHL